MGRKDPEFVANLRSLAKNCNFGETLDRMFLDRSVCGIPDHQARRFLLARKKLSLEEAEEFAFTSETVGDKAWAMRKRDSIEGDGGVHSFQSRHENRRPSREVTRTVDPRRSCQRQCAVTLAG